MAKDAARQTLRTSIDLVRAANDVHSGELEAIHAFNLGSGLAATALEAEALDGIGAFEMFQDLPEDVPVLWIHEGNKGLALEILQEAGFSQAIQKHIEQLHNKVVFFPLATFMRDGIPEAAWLEIDTETFFAIGVLASGERGAMLESAIKNFTKEMGKYVAGAVVGMESMIWGVASYALVYDDYGEILKAAAEEVTAIAEAVKKGLEDVAKWNPSKAKAIMEKVESKAVAYAGASLGEIAEAEAKEWITAQVKGWFDEKKNGLKDELLPDISFVGGMLDAIALYVELAQ